MGHRHGAGLTHGFRILRISILCGVMPAQALRAISSRTALG